MRASWLSIVVLVAFSLVADLICRSAAAPQEGRKMMDAAAERMNRLPATIGSWRMGESAPLSDRVLEMLQCRAHESRVYVDDETGETVSMILLVGEAGPLLAHTPEVCYSSLDFETIEKTHPETVRGQEASADVFDQVTFRSHQPGAADQRVYYGWRQAQGAWQAPKNPRLTLGGQPFLFKLQLSAAAPEGARDAGAESDAGRRFLLSLLPVLNNVLDGT